MPVEQIYQPQVAPGRTAALPQASDEAFGAGIGRAIVNAGRDWEGVEAEHKRKERELSENAEWSAAQKAGAKARIEIDAIRDRAEKEMAPGAAAPVVEQAVSEKRDAILNGIGSERVRRQIEGQWTEYSDSTVRGAYERDRVRVSNKSVDDAGEALQLSANRARGATDPQALGQELDAWSDHVAGLQVDDDVRRKLERQGSAAITHGYADGLKTRDPHALLTLIDKGAFNADLSPDQIDSLRSEAGVEIRRQQVEVNAATSAAKAEARETINTLQKKIGDGVPIEDSELQSAQALATKFALGGEVYDLGKARIVNTLNRVYRGATPVQLDAELKRHDTTIGTAGAKAEPADVIARDQVAKLLTQRTAEIREDPLQFGARQGIAIQPLNFSDPRSLETRATQAAAIARSTGGPVRLLTDEEATGMSAQLATGGAARVDVANQIAAFGPRNARLAALQVAPEDAVLQRAVTLGPKTRALALVGPQYRKDNPKLVPEKDSLEAYQAGAGRAMRHLGAEFGSATLETARNIYAGLQARNGGGEEFDAEVFGSALNMALGATRRDGKWQGGIGEWNGRKIVLPTDMTQDEVDQRLARGGEQLRAASNGNPAYSDGTPISAGQLRTRFTPVAVRDGVYRFEDPNGQTLTRTGGGAWLVDLHRVPAP